ncbi:RICIN domain-containing protein [Micromonospora sp. NPDC049171]|uniref:RICIN domain-containing protein n=1 Tax=Micromonospora sp. NPDC049171 TaxID=3155770 RepID=UPI0033C0F1D9
MSAPEERRPDPTGEERRPSSTGTVYGGSRRAARSGPLADPLLRLALAVGLVGIVLGVVFATGLLDGDDEPGVPATVGASSSAAAPTDAAAQTSPSAPAEPLTGSRVFKADSGLCLGLYGEGQQAKTHLAVCTGDPEQDWVITPVGPEVSTVANAASGQCLDVEGGSQDDGAPLMQFPCHGGANQQWRLNSTGAGPVLMVAVHSGKCAQADDEGIAAGDDIRQRPCDGGPAQQWTLG